MSVLCLGRAGLLTLTLLLAPRAHALDWAVVRYGVPEPGAATRAAEKLTRALVERRVNVASMHEVKDLMLSRSRPFMRLDEKDVEQISALRREALDHAAMGRRDKARKAGEAALTVALKAPETLLRDSDVARETFDACLAIVRVDLQEQDRERALADARRCRGLVPDLTPKESSHPAGVIGVLAEAENELRRAGAAPLTVTSDEGRECVVFVNGRRLGTTPYTLEHAPLGRVAVTLECAGNVSRVHLVELGDEPKALSVDAEHDTRVSDRDVLGLVYASEAELEAKLSRDTVRMGAELRAQQLVLVRAVRQGPVDIVRYDVARHRVVASVSVDAGEVAGTRLGAFQTAAEALVLGHADAPIPVAFSVPTGPVVHEASASAPLPAAQPVDAVVPSAPAPAPASERRRPVVWSWSFGAATLVSGAVGAGFAVATANKGKEFDRCVASDTTMSDCQGIADEGRSREIARNLGLGLAGGFAALTVGAILFERRERAGVSVSVQLTPRGLTARGAF